MAQQWTTRLLADGQDGLLLLTDDMLAALGAQIFDEVEVTVEGNAIKITPRRP